MTISAEPAENAESSQQESRRSQRALRCTSGPFTIAFVFFVSFVVKNVFGRLRCDVFDWDFAVDSFEEAGQHAAGA